MLTTIEMRWFYPDTIPAPVKDWFQQNSLGGQLQPVEERQDLYLYLPKSDYLGIKLRQGKLEIKWRQNQLGVVGFEKGLEGNAEKWTKWICEDPTAEIFQATNVVDKPEWISVKKVRSQRTYEGCTVELSQLQVQANNWWSLAFEASGDPEAIDSLRAIASIVFKTYQGTQLQAANSFGYPCWLCLSGIEFRSQEPEFRISWIAVNT